MADKTKAPKNPLVVRAAIFKKTGLPNGKFFYNTMGANGEVMNTSELYPSRSNAKRATNDLMDRIEQYLIATGRVVPASIAPSGKAASIGDAIRKAGIL